jgi:hypothetical protein
MIPPRAEYERFIYSIVRGFQSVEKSSLHFYSTSAAAGMLKGMIWFRNGLTLKVLEVSRTIRNLPSPHAFATRY